MLIELKLGKPVEPVGDCATFYYETENEYFIDEIKKYKCPFRLAMFLDEAMEEFDDIQELIKLEPNQKVDLLIDLLAESERMIKDPTLFAFSDKYLEQTNYLDKYGNEIEIEESDLTEKSDRRYEMQLDDMIYKN
ncbi:hypothetical protein CRU98_11325 [Arcobacter sp. CECT 8986]|uniref:hypothetical protein n=1 Tax=Arcobacter sp. CECT 8986 TaxID=2044507 RepID=UPI001009905A|nr:hypothetical protein [Arcobacter sp. CECT 8986]RXJ98100.1 hypothetical protein CRU98_11325 [Arcobacter sp. CECT 8986]